MSGMQSHWKHVYREKSPTEVSWYQAAPTCSLELIEGVLRGVGAVRGGPFHLLDIGSGASTLVDALVARGDVEVCAVDLAGEAFEHTRRRLGDAARRVEWIEADATHPLTACADTWADIWHDRAVFHFLTEAERRRGYAANLDRILRPDGRAVIATFAPDGPMRCSGLDVCRYDGAGIARALETAGAKVRLESEHHETHRTPSGSEQQFVYAVLRRRDTSGA